MNQLGMSNVLGVLFHDEEMDLFANLGDNNHFETMSASNYNSESESDYETSISYDLTGTSATLSLDRT